jgi:tetratricopeptide (TPR) repeat protein
MAGNRTVFEAAMKRAAEHAWNQHWDLALADYQRAADEFPDDMAARGNLALAYYRLGNWESALVHYSWMLERAPENAFIMDRLIEVYLKLERRGDAKKMQARLDALNQRQRAATGALAVQTGALPGGRAAAPAGQPAVRNEGLLTSQLTAFEQNEIIALAMAYEESGKIADAIRHYEQAISAGTDRSDVYYSLGLLYQQQGRHQEALGLFARCLDDADYAMSATFATGVSQRALGRRDDGARMLSLAISLIDHDQIGPAELDELVTIYRTAIEALTDIENYLQASNLAASLANFLAGQAGYATLSAEFRQLSQRLQAKLTTSLPAAEPPPPAAVTPPAAAPAAVPPVPPAGAEPAEVPVALPTAPVLATPPVAPSATPAALPKRGRPAARPAVIAPMPDEEAPERLATSYRRVTGGLGGERRGTGELGGAASAPAGPSGDAPARAGTAALASRPAAGRTTTLLAERTTMLLTDRPSPGTGSLRRQRLHALSGPLTGSAGQPAEVKALIEEADACARAGHQLGAIDACRAVVALAPGFVPIYLRLAELYAQRGELGLALETAQTALRTLNLRNAPADERLPFLRLIIRLRPADEAALSAFSETAHQAGRAAAAAPLIRRLVRRLYGRGATSRTLSESERLAQALPDDLSAQLHHADTLLLLGQPEPALELYRGALLRAPAQLHAIAGANLAFALLGQAALWWSSLESLLAAGRAAGARAGVSLRLHRRLAGSPVGPQVQAAAGLLLLATGRPKAAIPWLDALVTADALDAPLRAVVFHAAALIAAALDDPAAEREHRAATLALLARPEVAQTLAPLTLFDHPLTVSHLGLALAELHVRQGALAEAIQTLDGLRRAVPGNEAILSRLADLQLQAGRLGAALAALDELAGHHRDAGRLEAMAAVLDRMSQLAPNNVGVKTKLIDAYLERGFVEQAQRELELRAQLLAGSGKIAGALASLQKAAGICWTLGRREEAFALCERMIALQPTNADSRHYLITLYLQAGLIDRAVGQTWELAAMHSAAGNHRDAIAALHQIIGLAPDDAQAYHKLGEALAAIGEYAQAEKVYDRLARQAPDDAVARAKRMTMASLAAQQTSASDAA